VLLLVNKHSTPDDDNVGNLTHTVYKLIAAHAAKTDKKIAYLQGWLDSSFVSLMHYFGLDVGELQHSELILAIQLH